MSDQSLSYSGITIGDTVVRHTVEVHRANKANPEDAALRTVALLSDDSPNIYYVLKVTVNKTASTPGELALWAATIGNLMKKGKQRVEVSGDDGYGFNNAVMVDPVAVPVGDNINPIKALEMPFQFVSVDQPS